MARHSGKNGVIKVGGTAVGDVIDFDFETTAAEIDTSALNDGWDTVEAGSLSWSGNCTVRFNTADVQQQLIIAGAALAMELYTESDASGKEYFSGATIITNAGHTVQRNTAVDKKFTFKGNGPLDAATVV